MAEPEVAHLPAPITIPQEIVLTGEDIRTPRFTPRELDLIKERFGRSFSQIIADEESDDKFVLLAWFKLRRGGGRDVDFEQMRDVVIELKADVQQDPTSVLPSETSPPSATGGG